MKLRRLKPGERVRMIPKGQLYVVDRVNSCAAYLHKVYDPPIPRDIPDASQPEGVRRIMVHRGPVEPGISPCAFVYREEDVHG